MPEGASVIGSSREKPGKDREGEAKNGLRFTEAKIQSNFLEYIGGGKTPYTYPLLPFHV
mgnify:CR=1 FL=1